MGRFLFPAQRPLWLDFDGCANPGRGADMKSLILGDKFKSFFTGKVYAVKLIGNRMVLLESDDQLNRVLTEKEILRSFYQRVEGANRPQEPGLEGANERKDSGAA